MPAAAHIFSPDSLSASGKGSERLSLPSLQSRMKIDPEGYEAELGLLVRHFGSSLHLFRHHSAVSASTDPAVAKDLGDLAMFLAHVAPFYPGRLTEFPHQLAELLGSDGKSLPSSLRCHLCQALILLVNRQIVDIEESLELFMNLQILGDRTLRKLAFSHVVHTIRRMNQKHKNEAKNRKLQNILFSMLQGEDESRAKRCLIIIFDLHRRRVWFDDRTANAICTACFHPSSKIMIAALSFLLGYEKIQEEDDSDGSSSEDDTSHKQQVVLSREEVYKANHKGTVASKKKKKAKLQRVIRSMKKQQRRSTENRGSSYYSPLTHLKDAQGFAEKLFSRLHKCNERFEVRMMMLKVIARTVGLHRLILLNFYPFLQKYVQPHQRDVTDMLAAAVQACHDMVPPDAVEPLFKQIVNQFVHDRSRTEAIAVGLNVVREICLRMPLMMNEDLLQDLVLYRKSHEKAVSIAARSLITLFREICPSLLVKKDRGRPTNPKARPKEFGEVSIISDVPDIELLHDDDPAISSDEEADASDRELDRSCIPGTDCDSEAAYDVEKDSAVEDDEEEDAVSEEDEEEDDDDDDSDADDIDDNDDGEEKYDDESDAENADHDGGIYSGQADGDGGCDVDNDDVVEEEGGKSKALKRKFADYCGELSAAETSLRALKKLAGTKLAQVSPDATDGILSNEDFQRIKELKAKKDAKLALAQHGLLRKGSDPKSANFKIPSSELLSLKRVDPASLEVNIKRRISKEDKLALVRAGREEREKYVPRASIKKKKTGGLSNRQKEHKKAMPLAARKAKSVRSRQERKKKQKQSGKQFRGKKAWK